MILNHGCHKGGPKSSSPSPQDQIYFSFTSLLIYINMQGEYLNLKRNDCQFV